MPRTRGKKGATKASPKKTEATAAVVEGESTETVVEPQTQEQNVTETVMECEDVPADNEENAEVPVPKEETPVIENDENEQQENEQPTAQVENMETGDQEKKADPPLEGPKGPFYKPHSIPGFTNKSLVEKWEWHIKVFPIDQADIRSCVLDSVTKIAQETWMYIDNQNYGMGAYDLCIKNASDAATIVLKTLAMPMTYRYVTVKVSRRAKNAAEVRKITAKKNVPMGDDETDLDDALDELPFTEVAEKATLLLDYTQTYVLNKVKGQEKKRNLYVKYLPDSTSKELLKVLFPVANNLDIIKTGKGRRVGEVNVSTIPNILGICNSYVTTHINGRRNITLDWKEENIEDNRLVQESFVEIPWEIIPRDIEYPYETVPYIEVDDINEYGRKRLKEENLRQERVRDRDGRRRGGERMRDMRPGVGDVLRMQHEMNERISSQVALLTAVGDASVPPPLMGMPPGAYPGPPGPPGPPGGFRRDRRDDRRGRRGGDKERRNSSGGRAGGVGSDQNRDKGKDEKKNRDKDGPKGEGGADEGGEKPTDKVDKRPGRDGRSPQGRRSDGGGRFGGPGGRWENESRWGGRFDDQRGGFNKRGGRFDDRRGGDGRFDNRGGGRFGDRGGRGGGRSDDFGRGGGGRFGDRGGHGGMFEGDGRPGMMGEGPMMGGDMGMGRRGGRGAGAYGQGNAGRNNMRGQGMGDNQGFGDVRRMQNQQGGFGNQMGGGSGGGFGNKQNSYAAFMNPSGNQAASGGNYGQAGGFGNQSTGGGFSNMQDNSGGYGNQNQMNSYNTQQTGGMMDNQQGGFGNMSMQGGGFGNENKQASGYGNQSGTNSFVYSTGMTQQPTAYAGSQDTTSSIPGLGSLGDNSQSSQKMQTGFGNKSQSSSVQRGFGNQVGMNRQGSTSSTMNNQTGMGMQKQQEDVTSKTQSAIGSMANQNQQSMGVSQGSYGGQQSGFTNQQGSYGTQSYGNYGNDSSSYQQSYMNQQQQQQQQQVYGGYTADTSSGAWATPQGDYSQYSTQQPTQDTNQTTNYSTTSGMGQTDSYNTSSYNTSGAGYSADAAFANQGFYAAPQTNTTSGAYGEYSTQDGSTAAYATGNTSNMSNMATYNFASYNTGS